MILKRGYVFFFVVDPNVQIIRWVHINLEMKKYFEIRHQQNYTPSLHHKLI